VILMVENAGIIPTGNWVFYLWSASLMSPTHSQTTGMYGAPAQGLK
jgi:hypothetical protein